MFCYINTTNINKDARHKIHQWLWSTSSLFRFWTSARASCSKRCVNWMLCRICSEGRSTWCCKRWNFEASCGNLLNEHEILGHLGVYLKSWMFAVGTYSCWFLGFNVLKLLPAHFLQFGEKPGLLSPVVLPWSSGMRFTCVGRGTMETSPESHPKMSLKEMTYHG